MQWIIYIFSASFICMALALMFAYRRTRHYGLFLMAVAYAASAGLAIVLIHWWPLIAGFIIVWAMRLMGLDPGTDINKNGEQG